MDIDRDFDIVPARDTITPEEIPRLCQRLAHILYAASHAYAGVMAKDPHRIAAAAINIVEDILAIKRMLED